MRQFFRRLSDRAEFVIVILIAFGVPLAVAITTFVAPLAIRRHALLFDNARLLRTIGYELVIGALLARVLGIRGWSLQSLGLRDPKRGGRALLTEPLIGLAIAIGAYAVFVILWLLVANMLPLAARSLLSERVRSEHLALGLVTLVSIINPVFEEVFVCGYVITALRRQISVSAAINISAAIRISYHLYQGVPGVLGVTPFALIAAYWFARTGRLWPLIAGHALMDFIALGLRG